MYEQINELIGYLHGLWRYRWSALLITWLVCVIGWISVYSLPNKYNVTAAVHIDTSSIMTPLLQGLAVETNASEELNVMTRVLLSRENLLSVITKTDMDRGIDNPEEKERLIKNLAASIRLVNTSGTGRKGQQSNIYEIGYTSTSPEKAYKIVSTLLNTLIEDTLKSGRTDTVMAQGFLDEQIGDYEKRLTMAENKLVEFKKNNAGYMPDEKGGYYARLRAAQGNIEKTKSALTLAKQRYTDLQNQISRESTTISRDSSKTMKLRSLKQELSDLLTRFTEEHPDVQALRARIADLEKSEDGGSAGTDGSEFNPVYQELKVQLSQARIEVGKQQILLAEQQSYLNDLQKSIDIIPQVEANLVKLNRDYEITKERYLSLVERRESARLAQRVEQSSSEITFRVVDAPVVPLLPAGPNRPLLLAGVMVAATGIGFAWSVLMFLLYPTFVDYRQLRKSFDQPVLGSIKLNIGVEQRRRRRAQLLHYMAGVLLLFMTFGAVLLYQDPGTELVRALISDFG